MYGYGNVSNHLSFVPSSGKSASKGFDTCERNHAAPIKESSRPREQCDTRRGAQLQESEGDRTSHRAWTSFSRLTSASRLAKEPPLMPADCRGRGRGRRRTRPGAGARSRSRSAETRRACLYWVPLRGAAEPSSEQVRELKPYGVRTTCVPAPTTASRDVRRPRSRLRRCCPIRSWLRCEFCELFELFGCSSRRFLRVREKNLPP